MTEPQIVCAEFSSSSLDMYCPACGNKCITLVDDSGEVTPCSHLKFIFLPADRLWEYQSNDFLKKMGDINDDYFALNTKECLKK